MRIFGAVCVGGTLLPSVANAKCVPPKIQLTAVKGQSGSTLTVTGQNFWLRCIDEWGKDGKPPAEPARDIKILFKQGDRSVLLTTVKTADAKLEFSVMVTIPADAVPGSASVIAEDDSHQFRGSDFTPTTPSSVNLPGDERPRPVEFEVTR